MGPGPYLPVLVTARLILIPAPLLTGCTSYLAFYSALLSDRAFHDTAYGAYLPYKIYTISDAEVILHQKVKDEWSRRGFGDFGVALRPEPIPAPSGPAGSWAEYNAEEYAVFNIDIESLAWVGYGCFRDLSPPTNLFRAERDGTSAVPSNDWQEMLEIKYGLASTFWGQGLAPEIVKSLHTWGTSRLGARRFIGRTLTTNTRSGSVLKKTGYTEDHLDITPRMRDSITEWSYHPTRANDSSNNFAVPQGQGDLGWKY